MALSSGGHVTDLTPERAYDVDIRRLDDEEKGTAYAGDIRNEKQQDRVEKFLRAKKSAGKFRQKMNYDQPFTDRQGQTPAFIEGDPLAKLVPQTTLINRSLRQIGCTTHTQCFLKP